MDRWDFTVEGDVELFPQEGGWHYVRVPIEVTADLEHFAERGLIAVTAGVGGTTWDTSLLPMGDGTHFIALNARVRANEDIELGDRVAIGFTRRQRR